MSFKPLTKLTTITPLVLLGINTVFLCLVVSAFIVNRQLAFQFDPFSISCIFSGILAFFLGTFVYSKDPQHIVNRTWLVFSMFIALWSVGFGLTTFSTNYDEALFWAKVNHAGEIFIPAAYLHFILAFLNQAWDRKRLLLSVYLASAGLFFLNTLIFPIDVRPILSFPYYIQANTPFYFFTFMLSLTVSYALYRLVLEYRASHGLRKNQIAYVLAASVIGFVGGSTNFMPTFDLQVYPYGNYLVPIYIFLLAYAIIRYRVMDISTVIHKTAMWAVTWGLFAVPIGLFLYMNKRWIDQLPWWQFLLLVGGLFAIAIPYIRFVQPRIDHLFQRRLYDLRAVLDRFMRDVAIVKSIPDLSEMLVATIRRVFYAEPTTMLLWDAREHHYATAAGAPSAPVDWEDPWLQWLRGQSRVVELAEVAGGPDAELAATARDYAARTQAVFCLPLHRDGQLVVVVNIGPKQNLQRYSQPEREFLETLRMEASIALTNSLLYDEVKQLSEELEGKVEARTRELTVAMHQLKETESQLIQSEKLAAHGLLAAGVLHEINNPLSFSRGSLSVLKRALARVKEASQGAMDPLLAEVERAAEIIQNGHERIAAIVKDLKTFAKMDVQGIKPTDLHHNLDATVSLLRHELGDRITVEKAYGELGQIEVDPAQINQVFLNLLYNALQSIAGYGVITIKTWREGDRIFVSVRDTGQGIDPEHLPRIFEPFFTTKPVGHGTGLGLSVSHRIISEHGGQITVTSEVGRGTEFVIELPAQQTIANAAA